MAGSFAREGIQRVGFRRRFGVKLAILWAGESAPPLMARDGKRFKSLRKVAGKGVTT
jgi:hypothetical protein